jgi:hypothetical protein
MVVQSVLIPKTFTLDYAINWLLSQGYSINKVDITDKYWRFRQVEPNTKNRYFTKNLKNGIQLIIMA